jgi:hypothetical protein
LVALAVQNSLNLSGRAVCRSRNGTGQLFLDGVDRKTTQTLNPYGQPAQLLRTGRFSDNIRDLDSDLLDARTEPAQGKVNPVADVFTHFVIEQARSS